MQPAARLTDHDRFGSHWTLGANGSLDLGEGWRLRAAWGQGFKAPTPLPALRLRRNPALEPENQHQLRCRDRARERGGAFHFALTAFRRDSRNLIGYLWPSGYFNTGRARAEGVELELGAKVSERFRVQAAYSYVRAADRITSKSRPPPAPDGDRLGRLGQPAGRTQAGR